MAAPKQSSWTRLKRLAWHLHAVRRFPLSVPVWLRVQRRRRCWFSRAQIGRSAGFAKVYECWWWVGCCLRGWNRTKRTVATSGGEAELLVKAAAEGLGFQSFAIDLEVDLKVQLWVDSSAAKSVASRRNLGKSKRAAVKYISDRRCTVRKVAAACRPANIPYCPDLVTEVLGWLKSRRQEIRAAVKHRWELTWTTRMALGLSGVRIHD